MCFATNSRACARAGLPPLLDAIRVDYFGSPTPIKQLAAVSTPDPQQLLIKPFDAGSLKDIEKAIRTSDLGLAPNNDGKVIRLADSAYVRRPAQ